uniref:Uncharacterized protein n=1 Tax=Macrostomum lignano TaxID=282301 RepID=A0A1I8FB51_9PLAT
MHHATAGCHRGRGDQAPAIGGRRLRRRGAQKLPVRYAAAGSLAGGRPRPGQKNGQNPAAAAGSRGPTGGCDGPRAARAERSETGPSSKHYRALGDPGCRGFRLRKHGLCSCSRSSRRPCSAAATRQEYDTQAGVILGHPDARLK